MASSLYVTYLEKEGPYVKVWGQTNRSLPMSIEKALQQMTPQFEDGMFLPSVEYFQVGPLCCAKFKDGSYYRARITNISYLMQGLVEVLFIDYGNKDVIPCINIRTMTNLSPGLISIPPQARSFILANVTLPGWNSNMELISNELRYLEFQMIPIAEIGPYVLVSLFLEKQDITTNLLAHGLVTPTPLQMQQLVIQSLIERNSPPGIPVNLSQPTIPIQPKLPPGIPPPGIPPPTVTMAGSVQQAPTPTILTYKAMPLDHDCDYEVYVSYVSDGPCLFSVQLKKMEDQLKRLMTEINSIDLQQLEEYPLPGTVCLAQSTEDNYICRAVVTSMVDGLYKVFYVDFGNTELLSFDKLFQIPFKYVIPKVMATRFALAGLEQSTVSIEMKCAFKDFVNNRLLFMRVKPTTAKSALSLCDLWDEKSRKAFDVIRQVALQSYAEPVSVSRGFSQDVKVSYVYSCSRFYVQLKTKESELSQLMEMLQEVCLSAAPLNPAATKDGHPCFSLFEGDGLWYRAQVLSLDNDLYKVRYVDYGNEELVALENLREPHSELILALRPQAVECCLNGYQNMEANGQRDSLLEELILEQEFNMKVVEVQDGRALVDLSDSAHYNVASLLLDKIASVTSQVSPLLVQDDYRIEHRKRSSPQPTFQKEREFRERKPSREFNDRSREPKQQENWRQNKFSRSEDHQKNDANAPDKRDAFRRATSSNDDEWAAETNNFERQNSFRQTETRNDENQWDADGKPNRTGKRETYQHNNETRNDQEQWDADGKPTRTGRRDNEMRNGDNQFDRPRTFEKRDRPNRSDNQQRGRFNQHERQNSYRGQDSEKPRRHEDGFQHKNSGKFNSRGFNNHDGGGDGFRQNRRNDFKREGSEKSFSDSSETSWKKGPKSYNRTKNDTPGYGRSSNFSKAPVTNAGEGDWGSTGAAQAETLLDLAPETSQFKRPENLVGSNESVSISWFYNPTDFYCQLTKFKSDFKIMMEEIQEKYSSRKTIKPTVGQPVIAKFEEDGVLYRAVVLSLDFNNYKVKYVDYGNAANAKSVFAIETKYMDMPAHALKCALQCIGPSGPEWPNPDAFSSYFNRETFECQFIHEADETYFVELNHEGVRISTLLLEATLATSLQPAVELDASLLTSQQMTVVLHGVTSLAEITIALEPNLTVQASMHNLDGAAEVFEDTLRLYIGHFVIMFVDDVTEKGLEITLYDLTGRKLNIVSPDEGAYDTVDPICALPVYTKTLQGWVSHATANALYLQPSRFAEVLQQTLDLLYTHYETAAPEETLTPEIGTLYAVHSSDTNWYRGRITDLNESGAVVTYIDYGNSESVTVTELRMLHPRFYQPHMLAVEVLVGGVDCESFVGQEVTVSVSYGENEWLGQIISPVTVTSSDETNAGEAPKSEDAIPDESKAPPEPQEVVAPQIGVPVVMSHVDSPSEFYLQLVEAIEAIDFLQQGLQEQISNLSDLENPTPGVLCAAPYSVNQQWYRAQVLDADDDITTVRFIDFGNTDVLSNVSTSIKTLPSELLSVEQHSRLCSLYVKPVEAEEWSGEAFSKFEEYVDAEFLSAEIMHQDEKTTYVELYAGGKNVGEMLKNDGFAVDLQLETETNSTGFISHLNSPSEFWIQLENSVPDLEWVAEQLSSAGNYPVLDDVAPGALCAAVFPGDDSWYRARILSNTVAGLEVIFIDYGNSCSCMSVRELPEDLIMMPPLAHKCSLQKPAGILQWSQSTGDKFREISADGATVFDVNILTPGEKSVVQLTLDGEDISSRLLPEVKDCIVSHIDSLDSIWIVMNDDTKNLEGLTEILYQAEAWPEVSEAKEDDLVAALYEDGLWYRAKILNKTEDSWQVIFVDYGNTTVTKFIRELTDACNQLPPLAVNYRLDVLPQTKWADDSLSKFTELSAEGNTVFQMEPTGENATCLLYLNGRDIRLDIGTVKNSPSTSRQNTPQKSRGTPQRENAMKQELVDEVLVSSLKFEAAKSPDDAVETEVKVPNDIEPSRFPEDIEQIAPEMVTGAEERISTNPDADDSGVTSPKLEGETKEAEPIDVDVTRMDDVKKSVTNESAILSTNIEGETKEAEPIDVNVTRMGNVKKSVTNESAIASPNIDGETKEAESINVDVTRKEDLKESVTNESAIISPNIDGETKEADSIDVDVTRKDDVKKSATKESAIPSPNIEGETKEAEPMDDVKKSVTNESAIASLNIDGETKEAESINVDVTRKEDLKESVTNESEIASSKIEGKTKEVESIDVDVTREEDLKKFITNESAMPSPNIEGETIGAEPIDVGVTRKEDGLEQSITNESAIISPNVKGEIKEAEAIDVDVTRKDDGLEQSITNESAIVSPNVKGERKEAEPINVDVTRKEDGLEQSITNESAIISPNNESETEKSKPIDVNKKTKREDLKKSITSSENSTAKDSEVKSPEIGKSPIHVDATKVIERVEEKSLTDDPAHTSQTIEDAAEIVGKNPVDVGVTAVLVENLGKPVTDGATIKDLKVEDETNNLKRIPVDSATKVKESIVDNSAIACQEIKEINQTAVGNSESEVETLQSPITDVSSDEYLDAKDESIRDPPNDDAGSVSPEEHKKTRETFDGNNQKVIGSSEASETNSNPEKKTDEEHSGAGGH